MTLAAPIAVPPTKRNRLNAAIFQASPVPIELTKKIAAAISMTAMRPWRSASGPANQAPTAEPSSAPATAKPSNQEAAPDQSLIASTAPLITAVSKPKRKPPIAADAATRAILPTAMPSTAGPAVAGFVVSVVDMKRLQIVGARRPGEISLNHTVAGSPKLALTPDQLHYCGCERFRLFLWQVVAGARDFAMDPASGEPGAARLAVGRGRNAVALAVERDGRHADRWQRRKLALDLGITRIAVDQ